MNKIRKKAAKLGFTLIELSIVLVIIGLIVGGILVGQDLIKAAEIRATVSQMEKYSTAVNTFRGKYNGMPGDLLNASNFGFDATRGTSLSNGNSVIESAASGASGTFAGEVSCFWDDLTYAGMVSESLNQSAAGACGNAQTPPALTSAIPAAKLGRSNYIQVGSALGINYWVITGVSSITAGVLATTTALTASEAFQIDSKVDDGVATSGGTMAPNGTAVSTVAPYSTAPAISDTGTDAQEHNEAMFKGLSNGAGDATSGCVTGVGLYNFTWNNGNAQACQLRLRASF